MAKWTGKIQTVHRWFRSPKYLVEFRKEEGDHNPPECPELYWCEVDALRLDLIAFDLECRRREIETANCENDRLRHKLFEAGLSTKVVIDVEAGPGVDTRALHATIASCVQRFKDRPAAPFDFPPASKSKDV